MASNLVYSSETVLSAVQLLHATYSKIHWFIEIEGKAMQGSAKREYMIQKGIDDFLTDVLGVQVV